MEQDEDGALSFVVTSTGTNTNQSSAVISPDDEEDVEEQADDEQESANPTLRLCTSDK
jgi:hypothetical protein